MKHNFIVIEGLDGAGKSTQMALLRSYFEKENIAYEDIHFPMLNKGVYGRLIAEFLRGEYGALNEVHPKLVALLYGNDRKEHIGTLNKWLDDGKYILADRYVNSNIAYQCAKLEEETEKEALRAWILDFEYEVLQLPKPALSIFLDVPFSFTERSLKKVRSGEDREYLQGESDIHEDSLSLQRNVRAEYHNMVENQKDFIKIDCTDESDELFTPHVIHAKVIELLKKHDVIGQGISNK